MLTQEQTRQYLQRIDYHDSLTQESATLSDLQWAHLTHIPYENLNILAGIPLSLKPQDLFDKIVVDRRGGYCFELQGLFKELPSNMVKGTAVVRISIDTMTGKYYQ